MMKIYNKALGITSDDVLKCNEFERLRQWKMSVAVQRADILFECGVRKEEELPKGARREYLFLRRLETIIYRRLGELKKEAKEGRREQRAIAFQEACFRILPRWQYDLITAKSKEGGSNES